MQSKWNPYTNMCKLKNCSNSVTIEESDENDEQGNDSEISDDFDEDEILINFNSRTVLKMWLVGLRSQTF